MFPNNSYRLNNVIKIRITKFNIIKIDMNASKAFGHTLNSPKKFKGTCKLLSGCKYKFIRL